MTLWAKSGLTPDAEMLAFTTGEDATLDNQLIPYDLVGSAAHARGLEKIGMLTKSEADSLVKTLKALGDEYVAGAFRLAPGDEDCHSAIERELIARLGEVGKKIHTGRSRNDQVMTALRLLMKDRSLGINQQVAELGLAMGRAAQGTADVLMPGYTHGQRAMPVTLAFWYGAHYEALSVRGYNTHLRLAFDSPLGSGAGFGVPLPLDRQYTAQLMGLKVPQANALAVQNSRGRLEIAVLQWVLDLSLDVGKLAQDLWLFSTAEFGFVRLDDAFTTGSSLMPNKRNPDVLELLRATPATIAACRNEIERVIEGLPSGYHRDFQLTKPPLFRGLVAGERMLTAATRMISGIKWDHKRMADACTIDLFATHRALALVKSGTPFRDAYKKAAEELKAGNTKLWKTGIDAVREASHVGGPGAPTLDKVEQVFGTMRDMVAKERQELQQTWERLLRQ